MLALQAPAEPEPLLHRFGMHARHKERPCGRVAYIVGVSTHQASFVQNRVERVSDR